MFFRKTQQKTGFFILFLLISLVFSLFSTPESLANPLCPVDMEPKITVIATTSDVRTNFTLTTAELQRFNIDTISPFDQSEHAKVGGLMSGEIEVGTNITFGLQTDRRTGQTCFWYDEIKVVINIDPLIYVAREHGPGSCMHNSIMEHEMKHVEVDRRIVRTYRPLIENDIQRAARRVGIVGPVRQAQGLSVREKMLEVIQKTVSARSERMYAERHALQQAVDNLDEYQRVQRRCN